VARARAGEGPTLIEAKTYRITPHSAATPTDNRSPDELQHWRDLDPIGRYGMHLVESSIATEERLTVLGDEAEGEVEAAAQWALAMPPPEPDAAIDDVYAPADWNRRGRLS
jgi:TPP-dependent pyruvate/acetoin dehydrogenase alpha subunit